MRNVPELRWVLEGFTPEQIPMVRLAEYMQQLGRMLGQEDAVHFERIERGSVALVAGLDPYRAGRVRARVDGIPHGKAPADAMHAYRAINDMLAEDGKTATLREGSGASAVIVRFPGTPLAPRAVIQVPDSGTVTGYLYMLSDVGKEFHARIRLDSSGTLMCTVGREVAHKLRDHLFDVVKVFGTGIWARATDGEWAVMSFDITDVIRADSSSVRAVVDELRKLDIAWPEDPIGYSDAINEGRGTVQ